MKVQLMVYLLISFSCPNASYTLTCKVEKFNKLKHGNNGDMYQLMIIIHYYISKK